MGRFLVLLVLWAGLASAQSLKVERGWVRLVPGTTTAAYLLVSNSGNTPVRILGASSPIAGKVEMHETMTVQGHGDMAHGDTLGMRPVAAIVVPARGKVELKPGGLHLMMMGLKGPLKAGEKVSLTLRLEGGRSLTVQLPVQLEAP